MKVKILHEDADLIVCIKPQGVPAQSDKTRDNDMVNYLKNHVFEKYNMTEEPYIAVVHRLDRPVGGVMVFARTKEAAANLSNQIKNGDMEKYYQAVLTGTLKGEEGRLKDYVLKDGKTNTSTIVSEGTKDSKLAILDYEVLDIIETQEEVLSYVMIHLITGRHHQIRVQLANQGAGIWGDTKYNPKFQKVSKTYKQIGLFSTRLSFMHPTTKELMVFKEEPDGEAFDLLDVEEF